MWYNVFYADIPKSCIIIIDVVYIGVIHIYHGKLSKQILKAGKNVLCEKPVAASLSQFLEVQQVAKDCKCFFMEVKGNFLSVVRLTVKVENHCISCGLIFVTTHTSLISFIKDIFSVVYFETIKLNPLEIILNNKSTKF